MERFIFIKKVMTFNPCSYKARTSNSAKYIVKKSMTRYIFKVINWSEFTRNIEETSK